VLPGSRVTISNLVEWNWSGVDVSVLECSPTTDHSTWDLVVEPYDAGIFDDTVMTATGYTPPANPSPYDTPPDVVDLVIQGGLATPFTVYWSEAQVRSVTVYGTSFFTAVNLASYDGTKVNDGVTTVAAFTFNVAGTSSLTFDAGVGLTKSFRELTVYHSAIVNTPVLQWATSPAGPWTAVTTNRADTFTIGGGVFKTVYGWADLSGKRCWRLLKATAGAEAMTFYEVQWQEFTGPYLYAKGYKIIHTATGAEYGGLIAANKIPTAAAPITIEPLATRTTTAATWGAGGSATSAVAIKVVVVGGTEPGIESAGVAGSAGENSSSVALGGSADYVVQKTETGVTLATGDNNNVAVGAGPVPLIVSGPGGAFAISGFAMTGVSAGTLLHLRYAGLQICTIKAETLSVAANQIRTDRGNIVLAAGKWSAQFYYSGTETKWILDWVRDAGGYK
jgi:hypothetical protein